jgi:hypothetical protein
MGVTFKPTGLRDMLRVQNLVAGLAIVLTLGSVSAAVADDEDDPTFEQKIIRSLMGGGAARPDIDYRERSPLVIPPPGATEALPPPDTGTRARNATAWPKDPDKERARRAKTSGGPIGAFEQLREAERVHTPEEIRRGRKAGGGRVTTPPRISDSEHGSGRPLTPAEMGDKTTLFGLFNRATGSFTGSSETATFTAEPTRRTLTEPPVGYQTPAASQPYRAPPGTGLLGNIPTFFDHGTSGAPGSSPR